MEEKKGGSERRNVRETVMREQVTEVTSVSGGSGDVGGGVIRTNKQSTCKHNNGGDQADSLCCLSTAKMKTIKNCFCN